MGWVAGDGRTCPGQCEERGSTRVEFRKCGYLFEIMGNWWMLSVCCRSKCCSMVCLEVFSFNAPSTTCKVCVHMVARMHTCVNLNTAAQMRTVRAPWHTHLPSQQSLGTCLEPLSPRQLLLLLQHDPQPHLGTCPESLPPRPLFLLLQ